MVIIVYSAETKDSIKANIGIVDYSYYFVLVKYKKVLETFARVIEVRNPEQEVDAIYNKCQAKGESCLFLSFTPPFKTATELRCPTICVLAWEYATIPTDNWAGDDRNDWRTIFRKHGCAITHSNFAVRAIRKAMGEDFPVWSIPSPLWDEYTKLYQKGKAKAVSRGLDLSYKGVLIDFQGCKASVEEGKETFFIEKRSTNEEKINAHLEGIIYTSVFNPNDGRKNWMDLLWGYCYAFRDISDVTLVMKLVYFNFEEIRSSLINEIKKLAPFKCRVIVLDGYLDDEDYGRLIQESTYIVNTAYGEGQCLPLMEYMSAGTPAISPAHTAMEDYIDHLDAFVVQSSVEWYHWPHDPRHVLRTFRYRINWESLFNAYRESYDVAKNDPSRYARMSRKAVESLKVFCSAAVVKELLKQVISERTVRDNENFFSLLGVAKQMTHRIIHLIRNLYEKIRFRKRN